MKKKMVILLLTLGILGTAMGCGEKKDKTEDKEGTKTEQSSQEDFKLTNKDGKVVAVDVDNIEAPTDEPKQPVVKETKVGRNDPCPCGSGKKYKNCCGKN